MFNYSVAHISVSSDMVDTLKDPRYLCRTGIRHRKTTEAVCFSGQAGRNKKGYLRACQMILYACIKHLNEVLDGYLRR